MPAKPKVKPGDKFHRLTVRQDIGVAPGGYRLMLCDCVCGGTHKASTGSLLKGGVKSCGCLIKESAWKIKHGEYGTPTYTCWRSMLARCNNPTNKLYWMYGSVGITVAPQWTEFKTFLRDMGYRPSLLYSLDRWPNNDGNYEPGNVRWATAEEQARNRRNNLFLTFNGRKQLAIEWAEELGIKYVTLFGRLARGMSVEESLTKKLGTHSVSRRRK